MNLYICENIKRLRRERGLTQEKLAEHLNVSAPAVSKWERGETFPDITMVLPLATYFGVSADELLGLDTAKNEERIKEIFAQLHELAVTGRRAETLELMRRAYDEFPHNHRVLLSYAHELSIEGFTPDSPIRSVQNADEIIRMLTEVLEDTRDPKLRLSATRQLIDIYCDTDRREDAKKLCEQFPPRYSDTYDEQLWLCLEPNSEEIEQKERDNLNAALNFFIYKLRAMNWDDKTDAPVPEEEQIPLMQKVIAILDAVYVDGDYGIAINAYNDALCCIAYYSSDLDFALPYAERSLALAKRHDEYFAAGETVVHTSPLVRGATWNPRGLSTVRSENHVSLYLRSFEERAEFRADPRYAELFERYRALAGPLSAK